MERKNCGQLIIMSAIILTKYRCLIPVIAEQPSPSKASNVISKMNIEGINGKKIDDLARAAQALRTILRDFPDEWPHILRMFEIPQ